MANSNNSGIESQNISLDYLYFNNTKAIFLGSESSDERNNNFSIVTEELYNSIFEKWNKPL